ncbi:DMT family transporter [Pleionea litopenaei]|uniref:DMT family transporter n=1 Tax=Pleionea litopenaei TaxID=3070815 RepID=A0AA51RWB0_9GAMM|nr:DMT family transporter [Pleionea sp. HL-JVS1]WMS88846.1 DMT family transporter [Pleionea sp. HL-JVS1]
MDVIGLGEIFALSSALMWAIAVILFTKIGTRLPAFELNLIKNIIGALLLIITSWAVESVLVPNFSMTDWILVIISGFIGIAIADTLYMKALNTIGAGATGIVAALYSPSVVILSMFYLNESLGFMQWLGLVLVLGGIIFISLDKSPQLDNKKHPIKGIAYAATSVFLTALGVVMIKPIVEQEPFFYVTGLRLTIGIVGMLAWLFLLRQHKQCWQRIKTIDQWPMVITASVTGSFIAMSLWLAGYKYTSASIAAILNETNFIFIVILAAIILKEPISKNKWIGSGLTIAGVVLVVLS